MDFTILHFAIHIVWRANVICTYRKSGIARKTTVAYPELRYELFFTLSPEKSAIEHNVKRALLLADKSAYNYYQDFAEKGFYNRLIAGNINQSLQVDSVVCNFDNYPYQAKTYARQVILRESNVTERSLVTVCRLVNATRSDDNPNGFTIEGFTIVENRDISTVER